MKPKRSSSYYWRVTPNHLSTMQRVVRLLIAVADCEGLDISACFIRNSNSHASWCFVISRLQEYAAGLVCPHCGHSHVSPRAVKVLEAALWACYGFRDGYMWNAKQALKMLRNVKGGE